MSRVEKQAKGYSRTVELKPTRPSVDTAPNLSWGSLRATILFWFLIISIVPVLFVSLVGYNNAEKNRLTDFSHWLRSVSEMEKQATEDSFSNLQTHMGWQARYSGTRSFLARLDADFAVSGQDVGCWVHSDRWTNLVVKFGDPLKAFRIDSKAHDLLLVNSQGDVIFSCEQGEELGRNLVQGLLSHSKLGQASTVALKDGIPVFAGYENFQPQGDVPLAFQVEPILDPAGKTMGLLILSVGLEVFKHGVSWQEKVGPGTRFYVVDEMLDLLVPPSGYAGGLSSDTSVNHPEIRLWQQSLPVNHLASSELAHVRRLESTVRGYKGLNGQDSLGIIQDLDVMGTHFALVAETPRNEILAGLKRMNFSLMLVILVVGCLVVLAGLIVSYRAVDPINQLGRVMQRVADGHDASALPNRGPREVRQLVDMFHAMINKLSEATKVNERQYFLKRSQFELNEKLRGEPKLAAMAAGVLKYLGDYYDAQMGVFYLLESRNTFRLAAQFGTQDEGSLSKEIRQGQGLLGQVAAAQKLKVLRGVTEDRHQMETGLARFSVNNLILVPIHLEGRTYGILELGLFADLVDEDLELIKLVSENVAVAIKSGRSRERVRRLLKETWNQTAKLSRQQKELRESNRRLEQADQYKSEFLANMSHELRTPLNSLLIMSQVLAENRQQNLSREEVDSALTINKAGSDLLLLINDILDLSRVEAGKLDLCFEEFDLNSLVKEMDALFTPLAKEQGVEFRTVFGPGLPPIVVSDPLRLTQILKNILNNAFKFTEQGSVTFRVRRPAPGELASLETDGTQPWLVFSIADTGEGMSPETLAQIFEVFNQGDGSIGRRYGGSGLGLSISSKLCEMLGGQLRVDSVKSKGSTFSLFLPVIAGSDKALAPVVVSLGQVPKPLVDTGQRPDRVEDSISPASGFGLNQEKFLPNLEGKKVLLCDDDMRTVFQVTEILDDLGAEVVLAPSWAQGVEQARSAAAIDFAVVSPGLSDRPAGSSIEAWKSASADPGFPVLALVGEGDGTKGKGADLVGHRPVDRQEFLGLIQTVLAKGQIARTPTQEQGV